MKRTAEREEFLNDILCAFAEGGIQMIGEVIDSDFDSDRLFYNMVRVRYFDESTDHVVTIDTIASALNICKKGPVKFLSEERRKYYNRANAQNDDFDSSIDAVDATNIVEIGLFGEVTYS